LAQHPCRFSSGPRVGLQLRPAVLRSTDDVKADNRDGFHRRGGSSGAKANNHGTLVAKRGAIPLMAGGGGAERAHLAELRIQCARRGAAELAGGELAGAGGPGAAVRGRRRGFGGGSPKWWCGQRGYRSGMLGCQTERAIWGKPAAGAWPSLSFLCLLSFTVGGACRVHRRKSVGDHPALEDRVFDRDVGVDFDRCCPASC
jgi:hypothetical protein